MEKITTSDYILHSEEAKEFLQEHLMGTKMFNPIANRIECINTIFFRHKRENIGNYFKKNWKVHSVITGVGFKYWEDNQVKQAAYMFCEYTNNYMGIESHFIFLKYSGKEWIEKILPYRINLYGEITKQDRILN